MVRSAVFNSSPWIFLAKLGIIKPALSIFQQVYIPLSVNKEILTKPDKSASILKDLQKNRQVDIFEARNIRLVNALGNRRLNLFGELFTVSPDLQYEYVVATIDVKEQRLKLYLDKAQVDEFNYKLF